MPATFDVSPEKEGSIVNYFYGQLTQTPAEVKGVDLEGQTAIVTGYNVGIGLECSRQLLDLGLSKLILAVRKENKGKAAAVELSTGRDTPEDTIEVWKLDYSSYDSIRSFVERARTLNRLDIAILNAGILKGKMDFNPDTGHEETVQVNYLSTALLAILLPPVMKAKRSIQQKAGRITITSSDVGAWAAFNERDENPLLPSFARTGTTDLFERNCVTKLLVQLSLVELAKRVPASVAVINAATPMMVHDSQISRETAQSLLGKAKEVFRRRVGYTAGVGSRMITDAAVNHGEETHGQYLGLQKLKPMAPFVYTAEGRRVGELLWKETLAEFSFAGVEDILRDIGK
ncbi:Uu.00g098180.m01.CDS01 [Anthostomella pinea]|uniref:Uu.00g098180.m01.CDS01 n=1 Tax=Anthostomella pinea TaxID=933095 RepID=A0AAI8YCP8_9PEZI|nr:Uu.00g098180.m01.CDS01 [Anthostomella pinea]